MAWWDVHRGEEDSRHGQHGCGDVPEVDSSVSAEQTISWAYQSTTLNFTINIALLPWNVG